MSSIFTSPDLRYSRLAMAPTSPGRDPIAALALLDEPNRRRLYEVVVASHGEVGRDEAAAAAGLARPLAAFHLDRLVEGGLLEATYRRRSGRGGPGAGRPAKLYRRADTELSFSLPARRYADAAEVFVEALERVSGDGGASPVARAIGDIAREHGREVGREARRQVRLESGKRPRGATLRKALVDLLADGGYEPIAGSGKGELTLCNCPYRTLSDAHRELTCGMNLAWAEGVLDGLGARGIEPHFAPTPGRCCVTFETGPGSVAEGSRSAAGE